MLLVLAKGDRQNCRAQAPTILRGRASATSIPPRLGTARRSPASLSSVPRPGPRLLVVGCAHRRPDDSLCDGRGAPALVPNPRGHRTGRSALRDCDSGAAAPDSRLLAVLRPCSTRLGSPGAHAARRVSSHPRRRVRGLRRRRRLLRRRRSLGPPLSCTAPCTSSLPSACTCSYLGVTTPNAAFWSLSLLPWGLSNR